jgi:putative sigma-54 modulation protein
MRLALTGRPIEITPELHRVVTKKMARLERVLGDRAVSGQVELSLEKFRRVAEVHVHARGGHMLKGRAVATSWEGALSGAVDHLVQQARTLKGKWQGRKRAARATAGPVTAPAKGAARARRIVRARRYPVRAMTLDEAAHAMAPATDAFLVFRNASTEAINVMFRRKDGELGLIEPES